MRESILKALSLMRGLRYYNQNSFAFHRYVVSRKRDEALRNRVSIHDETIESLFGEYDTRFDTLNLSRLTPHNGFSVQDISDLDELYMYRSKPMQQLKIEVTTIENQRQCNTCQYCTISEVNSFDHILPREEFPEFVVNPKNLFPSCSKCNGHKSIAWRNGDRRRFLNLYIDQLPNEQYLFVNLTVATELFGLVETDFEVINTGRIDQELFEHIYSHYDRLHLCQRFALCSNDVITELENTFRAGTNKYITRDEVVRTCNLNRETFGFNHWRDILKIELSRHENFLARFPEP